MPMQEFLASFGVEVDESGTNRLQEILKENKTLADDLSRAFAAARSALKPLLSTTAVEALNTLQTSGALNLRLTADASGVIAAASTALASIKAAYSGTTLSLAARVTTAGGDLSGISGSSGRSGGVASGASGIMASIGGRFTRRTRAEVAEDGQTEYIIPVQKEAIAVPLLRQLLSELSDSARESILGKMPSPASLLAEAPRQTAAATPASSILSAASLLSAAPGLSAAAPAPAHVVQAPVNITVNAAGASPEAVGRSVYNLAERYLQRTLQS